MTWLTWRQFRVPAVSVFAGLAVLVGYLLITGARLVGRTDFSDQEVMFGLTILVMYLLPAVVGVFWGVPIVTRELESGTHSLVWNQTVTRQRWLMTKLTVGVAAAMVAAALLATTVSWWASPIDALANLQADREMLNRLSPVVFAARGIAPIGYAAFAFVVGVAVGILLRRTVAAMAVTLVALAAVMVAVPLLVRPYLLPSTEETVTVTESNLYQIRGSEDGGLEEVTVLQPPGAWVLTNETVDRDGNVVSPLPATLRDCLPPPPSPGEPPRSVPGPIDQCITQGLADLGYQQRVTYQPGSNFWPLQWLELALFLALSSLLAWFCFRRIRHLS